MPQTRSDQPTPRHVVWPVTDSDRKRVATRPLVDWAEDRGYDVRRYARRDPQRGDERREQLQCVFRWGSPDATTLSLGERTWDFGGDRVPATYIEVDTRGFARVSLWDSDVVLDVHTLHVEGPKLVVTAANFYGERHLYGEELGQADPPDDRKTARL